MLASAYDDREGGASAFVGDNMANVGFTTPGEDQRGRQRGCDFCRLHDCSTPIGKAMVRLRRHSTRAFFPLPLVVLVHGVVLTAVPFNQMYDEARRWQIQAARIAARLAEVQQDVPPMHLQPHFLFNTLQAATILASEGSRGAEDILLRLSELLRVLLDELHVQEIPPECKVRFLAHSMESQA
jgi:hypothetical protein